MKKVLTLLILLGTIIPAEAQRTLNLDSCRALALRNNKQINVSRLKQDMAQNIKKAAKTKYLPKVDAIGGYEYYSRSVSLLSNDQKSLLNNLGTNMLSSGSANLSNILTDMVQRGIISTSAAQQISGMVSDNAGNIASAGNQAGKDIADAFETNTHNVWAGTVMVRQPIFMGGAITAMNNIAKINQQLVANDMDAKTQVTLYNTDQAYWTVVSLKQKQKLADSYCGLVKKLNSDVHKMIKEGVATRADGLKVDVRVNEAEMNITQVDDGLVLAKMYLCQLCGLPLDEDITLADEDKKQIDVDASLMPTEADKDAAKMQRPELRMLQNAVEMSSEATKMVRAAYLPHVLLTGGYLISNPSVFNSFERKFKGTWNVGIIVQVPIWNWFEGAYKVRTSKSATAIAKMELADASEKIDLQITQGQFKVKEAQKKLIMAQKNIKSAEENLRCANIGFKEGVMETTDVMSAQTAWQQAQSQKIDAEIEVKLSLVNLQKAMGELH